MKWLMLKIAILLCNLSLLVFSEVTRQGLYKEVIHRLSNNSKCISNLQIVPEYIKSLKNNNMQILKPRYLKNQMDDFLSKLNFQKSFQGFQYESLVYNICQTQHKQKPRYPWTNKTNINTSITNMIKTYPYLVDNLRPQKMIRLFNLLDAKTQSQLYFVEYLIKDHILYIKQTRRNQLDFQETFVNTLPRVLHLLPNMYFYHVARDEFPLTVLKDWIQQKTNDHLKYDGLYESVRRAMVEFPLLLRSIDLSSELQFNKFVLPDSYLLRDDWSNKVQQAKRGSKLTSWHNKKDMIIFRGCLTGKLYLDGDMFQNLPRTFPRLYALNFSTAYPNIMDFKYIKDSTISEQELKLYNITIQKGGFVSLSDQLKNKYLMSFDGYTAAWQRVPLALISNSLLIKQQSLKVEWFYQSMLPNVHYISVKQDLSDLVQKFQFLNNNEQFAINITKAANEYAKRFNLKQVYFDFISILKQYAQHQKLTDQQANYILQTRKFSFQSRRQYYKLIRDTYSQKQLQQIEKQITQRMILIVVISIIVICVLTTLILNFIKRYRLSKTSRIGVLNDMNQDSNLMQNSNHQV